MNSQHRENASGVAPERLAYRIGQFCKEIGFGRTKAYEEIAARRLKTVKAGRVTLVTAQAAKDYIDLLRREAGQ